MPRRRPHIEARVGWGLLLFALVVGLVGTNPGPGAFEEFAAERLSALIKDEFCDQGGLPLMLRLVIQDCPGLVRSQRSLLGRLARENSRRYNLGVVSLYRTELGGQRILSRWHLPRYEALTLGLAGQLLVLRAREVAVEMRDGRQGWLSGGSR